MSTALTDFLRDLEQSRFYGSVELKYESGRITVAKKAETIKLTDSRPNHSRDHRGGNNEQQR